MSSNTPVRPIWDITEAIWVNHGPNRRFAIYHPATSGGVNNDVVLDRETRLVWERAPSANTQIWDAAVVFSCAQAVAGRMGWRLPTIEELLSLVDPTQSNPTLPVGHPFNNVQININYYWSSTLGMSFLPTCAWGYNFGNGVTANVPKITPCYVWLVRGGYGHDYPY